MNKYSKILFLVIVISFHIKTYGQTIDTACIGETNARYNVNQIPGSSYFWQVSGGIISNGQGTNSIEINWGIVPGLYALNMTETNASNCVGNINNANILLILKPKINIVGPDSVCEGQQFSLQANGAINYMWENGNGGNELLIKAVTTKTYLVVGSNQVCSNDTAYKKVVVITKPSALFTPNPFNDWMVNDNILFTSIDTTIRKWIWELNGDNLNINKPKFNYMFNNAGLQSVMLIASNYYNCTDTFTINRTVLNNFTIYLPSAFTPNNDNLNDVFEPIATSFSSYQMQIFDHFGGLIYEGINKGWDGKINGNEYASDNYYYKLNIILLNGKNKTINGNVVLIR